MKRTVLCIEDDELNRRLVARVLRSRSDVSVLAAASGEVGVRIARERLPNLILLDRRLPDRRGVDVLRELKSTAKTARIPVVVLSGDSDRKAVTEVLELGAEEFISKPYDMDELLRVVDRFCGVTGPGG